MIDWYAPDGRPIDMMAANELLGNIDAKQLRYTTLVTERGTVGVSTVFLVLDHNHSGVGPPVLWETMVFGGPDDMAQRRYSSRDAALEGHAETVTFVLSALDAEGTKVLTDETVAGRA